MKSTLRPIDGKAYENYYLHQVGHGVPVFEGVNLQRGYGLGGILGGLLRSAVPLLKQGAKALGKQVLKTGVGIAQDTLAGQNFRTAAKRRLKESGKTLGRQAVRKMTGSGRKGRGRRKNGRNKNSIKRRRNRANSVISSQRKRQRRSLDIFDY